MILRSWIRKLFGLKARSFVARRGSRLRLAVEALEDRLTPAYPAITPLTGPTNPFNGITVGLLSTPSWGDVDGDGDLDAVVGTARTVLYFRNTGSATAPTYALQSGDANPFNGVDFGVNALGTAALGDLDGDLDLDLLVGATDGTLRYFQNMGTASSPNYVQQTGTSNPFDNVNLGAYVRPALGDVDGDGDLDVALAVGAGTLSYYRNTGSVTAPAFTPQTGDDNPFNGINGGALDTLALADLDRDGDLDAIAGADDGTLSYYRNTGSVTAPAFTPRTGDANPFNGMDVGVSSLPSLADVDGDGDLDALVVSASLFDSRMHFFLNAGTSARPAYQQVNAGNPFHNLEVDPYSAPALGDVDGDGDLDLVVGGIDGTLRYFQYLDSGTGTETRPVYVPRAGAANNPFNSIDVGRLSAPALGDLDGDGDLDLVVGAEDGTLAYFKNLGSATRPDFVRQTDDANPFNSIRAGSVTKPSLGDVDGDGDLDLLLGAQDGALRYFRNNGSATRADYAEQTDAASNPFDGIDAGLDDAPALGDLDGDGDLDLVVGSSSGDLTYFQNTGSATAPAYARQTGTADPFGSLPFDGLAVNNNSRPVLGDVDGDGDLDLVVGGLFAKLIIFRNDSVRPDVTYLAVSSSTIDGINVGSFSKPALGDVDGDGDLDLVVGTADGTLRYFENTGSATALAYTERTGGSNPFDGLRAGIPGEGLVKPWFRDSLAKPALGDVDGDGDLDLVVGGTSGAVYFWRNTGSAIRPSYVQQFDGDNPFNGVAVPFAAPALGDVDGDGDLDAVVGGITGRLTTYTNVGTATSPAYQQLFASRQTGSFAAVPALGDVDGDGDLDAVVGVERLDVGSAPTLRYFVNTGGRFDQQTDANPFAFAFFSSGPDQAAPALGDLDGDGDLDAIVGAKSGGLSYLRASRVPVVANAIPDQTFTGPGTHGYTVPADTFLDLDRDPLFYSATLADGSGLPAWLTFDAATRTFRGNPEAGDASPLRIRVTAGDVPILFQSLFGSASAEFQLTLVNVADNIAPTLTRDVSALSVNEGSPAANAGTFDDAQGRGSVTLTASLGTVSQDNAAGTWSWSYTPPDGPDGPTTVTVTATDAGGLTATVTFSLTVNDVAPTIAISGAAGVNEGATYTLTLGDVTDPGSDEVKQFVVNWGDGSSDTYDTAGEKTHVYSGGGTRAITVDLVDGDGTHADRANPLSVDVNAAPTDIALSNSSVAENQPSGTVVGSFTTTDPDDGDSHTYSLVSGDGDNDAFKIVGGQLQTKAGFDYEAKNSYGIRVLATDAAGLSFEKAFTIGVSNVNETPTLVVPVAHLAYEDVNRSLSGITVGDPEGTSLTVTLAVSHGTLKLGTTAGLTVTGNRTASVTLSGSMIDLNAALASLVYRGRLNYSGGDTLRTTAGDGSLSTSADVAINVKSAATQAANLRTQVNGLVAAGVLSREQARDLNSKLVNKGGKDPSRQVEKFLREVADLLDSGTLTRPQADALLGLGNILLLSVTRR